MLAFDKFQQEQGEFVNLRNLARGQDCTIRLPDICCFDNDTTVLAHVRLGGISGMGYKAFDLLGAHACHKCHAVVDSPATYGVERDYARLAHLEGMVRTIAKLIEEGVVKT